MNTQALQAAIKRITPSETHNDITELFKEFNGVVKDKVYCDSAIKICKEFKESLPEKFRPKKKSIMFEWMDCVEKSHRIDGYSYERISEICRVFRDDPFWSGNFYSPCKLRTLNKEKVKYIDVFDEKLKGGTNKEDIEKANTLANWARSETFKMDSSTTQARKEEYIIELINGSKWPENIKQLALRK